MDDEEYYLSLIPKPQPDRYKPRMISQPIKQVLAKYGVAHEQAHHLREEIWRKIVGEKLAADSRLGHLRRGSLLVLIRNHVVLQEFHLRKRSIITALRDNGMTDIQNLTFKVEVF